MLYILFFIGIYFLIGALVFIYFIHKICKAYGYSIINVKEIDINFTTQDGEYFSKMTCVAYFLIKWPFLIKYILNRKDK